MTKRKTAYDYEISDEFWNKIKPLLPLLKAKKKLGKPRKDDRKIMSGIFIYSVLVANGNYCHGFMEPQVPYMIDFRSGKSLDYLRICGKLVYWSMIIKTD